MALGTIFIIVLIGYVFLYAGLIIHDLYFNKQEVVATTIEEEEIDISDEAQTFQPINVESIFAKSNTKKQETEEETEIMNGGFDLDELLVKVNDLAENGENSELANLCSSWSVA